MWSPSLWRVNETHDELGVSFTSPNIPIQGNEPEKHMQEERDGNGDVLVA
jgi:hypothetical protein